MDLYQVLINQNTINYSLLNSAICAIPICDSQLPSFGYREEEARGLRLQVSITRGFMTKHCYYLDIYSEQNGPTLLLYFIENFYNEVIY